MLCSRACACFFPASCFVVISAARSRLHDVQEEGREIPIQTIQDHHQTTHQQTISSCGGGRGTNTDRTSTENRHASHGSWIMDHGSWIMDHASCIMYRVSCIMSSIMCHVLFHVVRRVNVNVVVCITSFSLVGSLALLWCHRHGPSCLVATEQMR